VRAFDVSNFQWTPKWTFGNFTYPWGSNIGQYASAYGLIYIACYDGHVRAVNIDTGKQVWDWFVGSTSELPFGTWSFRSGLSIADGKLYIGNFEHSATEPLARGYGTYCLDAYTGQQLWNISIWSPTPSGPYDGYLIETNMYNGVQYCIGKGQTETSVSVQNDVVAKGGSVLIKGTVNDISPAQPDTPAVSDDSMTAWMEYLHLQMPLNVDITGVSVKLTAVKADGSTIDIGTVQSDSAGMFKKLWSPPDTGEYTIVAAFNGSKSYWSSCGETAIGVTAAPAASVTQPNTSASPSASASTSTSASPSQPASPSVSASASASPSVAPPPSTEAAPSMTLYIALAAAAAIIVIAAAAVIIRKRK
jgi:hypothetical protein